MEQTHTVSVLSVDKLTHDVFRFRVERPAGYFFTPGQATELSINRPGLINERRPFTFTSLQDEAWLEFIIKSYPHRDGVTKELGSLKSGDSLIIRDVWGAIAYSGPGYFIAGGAGITPFIAILRQLAKEDALSGNKLFFANKTRMDIILKEELDRLLRNDVVYVLSEDSGADGCINGHIDRAFLAERIDDISKRFYVCGPEGMVKDISSTLSSLGAVADRVIFER